MHLNSKILPSDGSGNVSSNFLTKAGAWIEAIRINRVSLEEREGRAIWVKQRRRWSGAVIRCANFFFRTIGQPVSVHASVPLWQKWEIDCFNLLNGDHFSAFAENPRKVCADRVPGKSIAAHFDEQTFSEEMLEAAALELRRVHGLYSSEFKGFWSHGDANLANFIYDPTEGRTRMIDFELIHQRSLSAGERQADDLLVFLQDLCGCIEPDRWLPAALRFLRGYGTGPALESLCKRLTVPRGLPLVWWVIRANYVWPGELRRRFKALSEGVNSPGFSKGIGDIQ